MENPAIEKVITIRYVLYIVAITILAVLMAMIFWDSIRMERISLKDRVATLEQLMREKSRPMIHIERASVYNTDGEIVIEDIATKIPRYKGK